MPRKILALTALLLIWSGAPRAQGGGDATAVLKAAAAAMGTATVKTIQYTGTGWNAMMGQSYLPTKAAFEWRPDRWVGLITRVQSARAASMGDQIGANPQIHHARLIVVPTTPVAPTTATRVIAPPDRSAAPAGSRRRRARTPNAAHGRPRARARPGSRMRS